MEKIALIVGDRIGDSLTAMPIINSLRRKYPNAEIKLIFQRSGIGEKILRKNVKTESFIFEIDEKINARNVFRVLRGLFTLWREKFDVVADVFPSTNRTAFLTFLLRGKRKIGTRWFLNKMTYFYDTVVDCEGKRSIDINREIFENITGSSDGYNLDFDFPEKNNKITKGFTGRQFTVAVFLGQENDVSRTWPIEKWKKLLESIHRYNSNISFVLIGAKAEKKRADSLNKILDFKIADFVDKLDVYETITFLKKCKFFIGTDGGPVHMAGIVHTPGIVILGNSPPQWQSFGSLTYLKSKFDCFSYCWKYGKCKFGENSHPCTDSIEPEEVLAIFEKSFQSKNKKLILNRSRNN